MRIQAIREKTFPMSSDIRNAVIDFSQMTTSVVAVLSDVVRDGKPLVGYGFNSNGRYGQGGLLRERFIPRLSSAAPDALLSDDGDNVDPHKAWRIMMRNEKPGGHGERSVAVGTLDMALWDLAAKIEDRPLYLMLAQRYNDGQTAPQVPVYAAGGYYYPGKDVEQLQDEIRGYLDLGHNAVKIKIGGATLEEDLKRIEAVLDVVGQGERLAVDANGRFDLDEALRYAEALAPYGLRWYEEPGDPLDYEIHAAVAEVSKTPIATGENLFSMLDARNLIRYGGMQPQRDILQFDPVLSYGLVEYLRTLRMLESCGWSRSQCIPHGGHQFNLQIAAGLGLGAIETYPRVFEPYGHFGDRTAAADGIIRVPDLPGIGYEMNSRFMEIASSVCSA